MNKQTKGTGKKVTRNSCGRNSNYKSGNRNKVVEDCSTRKDIDTSDNDPSWYSKNPQLLKDAASITTSNVSGYPVNLLNTGDVTYSNSAKSTPGIFTLVTAPSIGAYANSASASTNATSPVNLAAKNIYSYIRHANSGASNYDSPDLMCAILAADQVFSALAFGIRAYGIAMNYSQRNRYTPIALLRAMGFDPNSIIDNLASFRYRLNNLIARASVIWVPSNMSLVARHYWMYSNIYTDSENPKAQFYMYVPAAFWKFEPKQQTTGSSLSVVQWATSSAAHTADDYFAKVSSMLDPIISDEDMGIMFGDMLKAYGKENLYTLNMIPENYTILPVYNKEVMYQIHNSTAIGVKPSNVLQKEGVIYQEYGEMERGAAPLWSSVVNYWEESPTPETVMVSTRLHAACNYRVQNDVPKGAVHCATEYVFAYRVFWYENDELKWDYFYTIANDDKLTIILESVLSKFDWVPIHYQATLTPGSGAATDKWTVNALLGDLDNYTIMDVNTLDKMHTTALFSEFNVPIQV